MTRKYLFFVEQAYSFEILRPIQAEIAMRGDQSAWFLCGGGVSSSALTTHEMELKTTEQVKAFQPDAVFVPGNIVPDFFPGVKVQVFHGLEYKKKGHFAIRQFFDLYCTHGPLTTKPFEVLALKHKHFKVVETGWPKLDPYFHFTKAPSSRPTVLYAPTFSPSLSSLPALASSLKALSLSGEYNIVIKFHPKTQSSWQKLYRDLENERLKIELGNNLIPLIQQADVVLSDTSSAVDEALLLGKPVITFRNSAPQSALLNFTAAEQLPKMLLHALSKDQQHLRLIAEYIKQVHPYQDGKSASRVLDATEKLINDGVKRKPLNLIRRYKIRKKLAYYHLT